MVDPVPGGASLPPPPPPLFAAPPPAPATIGPAPPYGMPTQVRPLLRVRTLGTAVQCSLGVVIAVSLFGAWTTWNRRSLLIDVREGRVVAAVLAILVVRRIRQAQMVRFGALVA